METFQEFQASTSQESQASTSQGFQASTAENIQETSAAPASHSQHTTPIITRTKGSKYNRCKDIARAVVELKQLQQSISVAPPNQFAVFGSSVAAQLQALPYDKALIAQLKLQSMLTDIALENFRNNMMSSTILSDVILSSSGTTANDTDDHSDITLRSEVYENPPADVLSH
jgi:hypothetical protein